MRSILRTALLAAATLSFTAMAEFDPTTNTDGQDPHNSAGDLKLRQMTDLGCFSSPGDMFDMGVYTYQSPGWCQALCTRLAKSYFANVNGSNCFCGDAPPSQNYKVDNSLCNKFCGGTKAVNCGGINLWDVQDGNYQIGDPTGTQVITIPKPTYTWSPPASSSTSSSSATRPATVVITQQATTTPTVTPTATPDSSSSGGPNTAAIAAGVVVGIVLLFAVAGGAYFYMRRRKQQSLVEEQRRHEMITQFVTGEKPRSGYTSPDSRLDPSLMFQRRLSDGSIRDNEDYSRRILKVANPDD